ncbi:MAG TPA: GcrA family cell cycle regulator [Bauldia sp.]|nr:GcrA family cell cycle regulator [Bauldia sp.]
MSWTDERVELLKKLWIDGLSASQIAAQLGGVTRNAVIGKVHRLNLSGRAKPAPTTPRPRKAGRVPGAAQRPPARGFVAGNTALKIHAHPAPRRIPSPVPIEDLVVPISLNVSLMQLNDSMCKWPIGDPTAENFCFCGHRSYNSLPYCEYHSRIAYQPVERRRDRRDRDW